ncbi:glucan endo-1,3-beta-glucosidase 4 isoform X2 [Musa acuminata AAA Group]|uniref:glucan endo-1,3-beta-glucosidase 4 isoform X2 n=1 Tax=Musa acuminata AAA Group TaxID=214697 RepID=UPI0031E26B6F
MVPGKWERSIFLLVLLFANASGVYVGINIGNMVSNLPSAADIVSILKTQQIKHVRLFDANHQMLGALANTGIDVMLGVPNDQLLRIGNSRSEAADWINKNVAAFVPETNITYIAVGNEILTSIPNAALVLVPAMQFLQSALVASNLNSQVKVSSPLSMDMIPKSFPPSTATFNSSWNSVMSQYLQFLKNTGSPLMVNAQPYYGYIKGQGIYPLEYALFQPLNPNNQIVDPNTNFYYTNMFDAMVDAAYYSMQSLNFTGIPVIVTASGWPSQGGANESDATVDNALIYNSNLVHRVLNNSGTPSQPTTAVSTYIYELFNEDLRPGPVSEKNWGIFFSNETAVYSLSFGNQAVSKPDPTGLVGVFCVANPSADSSALKKGLDWACGPGEANCTAILPGEPCYDASNLVALASYAYNDYYHRMKASGGTCSFGNTAMISSTNPSHGSCVFAGSSGPSNSTDSSSAFGPSLSYGVAQKLQLLCLALILQIVLFYLFDI